MLAGSQELSCPSKGTGLYWFYLGLARFMVQSPVRPGRAKNEQCHGAVHPHRGCGTDIGNTPRRVSLYCNFELKNSKSVISGIWGSHKPWLENTAPAQGSPGSASSRSPGGLRCPGPAAVSWAPPGAPVLAVLFGSGTSTALPCCLLPSKAPGPWGWRRVIEAIRLFTLRKS